jgi:FkbM family methyltransferase
VQYRNVKATDGTLLREFYAGGVRMLFADIEGSVAVEVVAGEIGYGAYDFSDLTFSPGDVIIDLGAHIGVVSTFLAKKHPHVIIHSFEPTPPVFALLVENLHRNRIDNVIPHNLAVSATTGTVDLLSHLHSNSAGSSACLRATCLAGHERFTVDALSLDDIFDRFQITRCALLKIDIEGAEHDVLRASKYLHRVRCIRGEFHESEHLTSRGHSIEGLRAFCEANLGPLSVRYTSCQLPDV